MSDIAQKLLNFKEKIEEGKEKKLKLIGQKEEVMKALKKEFKCKTIKSGKELIKSMKQEEDKEESILEKQIKNLERRIN